MDKYAHRVACLRELLKRTTAADLARASGVAPSYISRALLDPAEVSHKKIGETTGEKLESGARKLGIDEGRPSGWLLWGTSPQPQRQPTLELVSASKDAVLRALWLCAAHKDGTIELPDHENMVVAATMIHLSPADIDAFMAARKYRVVPSDTSRQNPPTTPAPSKRTRAESPKPADTP